MTDGSGLVAPPHLSPSSISTFKQCPLRFKYSRIDGIPEPPTEASIMGNFVHDIMETLYRTSADERTLMNAKLIASQVWTQYEERVTDLLHNKADAIRMFRWNSWWCVENVFTMEDPTAREFDGLEHELNHTLFSDRGTPVIVKGFVDRWHFDGDNIVIGDYKTGKVPSINYRKDKFEQLLIYAHVLREQLKKQVSAIELLYIKSGEVLRHVPSEDDFEEVAQDMMQTRRAIDERCQTGQFEHKRSRLCDWCAYKRICPAWRNN